MMKTLWPRDRISFDFHPRGEYEGRKEGTFQLLEFGENLDYPEIGFEFHIRVKKIDGTERSYPIIFLENVETHRAR